MDFDKAFAKLLGHEGDFSDHKDDPGGATRFGVTEAVARANGYRGPMRELPLETAKAIYRRLYWDAVKADELPQGLRYSVFDAAVNSGVSQALKWLQRAVGASPDGRIGPQTLSLASSTNPEQTLRRMLAERLRFMTDLKNWPTFSRGWARRISDLLMV